MTGSEQVRRFELRVCDGCGYASQPSGAPHCKAETSTVVSALSVADLRRQIVDLRDPDELPDSYQLGWNEALAAVAERLGIDVERKD